MHDPIDHQPDWYNTGNDPEQQKLEIPTENQFILLCVLTLGLYAIWWMYKKWRFFEDREQQKLYPVLRAVFSIIFLYGFFDRIKRFGLENNLQVTYSPLALFLGYIGIAIAGYLPEPYFLIALFGYLLLLPPYRTFYQALDASEGYTVVWQEGFNQRQLALVFLGGFLWLVMIIGLLGG